MNTYSVSPSSNNNALNNELAEFDLSHQRHKVEDIK
jgi:hypothetical protein